MKKELEKIIKQAVKETFGIKEVNFAPVKSAKGGARGEQFNWVNVDYARDEKFGDYATNVAMVLGKVLKKNPLEVANDLLAVFGSRFTDKFEKIEIAKPGYINFYLSKEYLQNKVAEIQELGQKYGSQQNEAVLVNDEFISANPTGPLHLGNGRGGFYGDTIANVLKKAGYQVKKEYYVNDAGEQVIKLGHSVLKDSEAIYAGSYIDDLNRRLPEITKKIKSEQVKDIGWKASELIMKEIIEKTIELKMNIKEMNYVFERDLYHSETEEKNNIERAMDILKGKGLIYEKDGALWLKTMQFGDDKDRVLVKTDGQKTYFASDCGYILYKIERGFGKIIEIWGADHHGYISRFRAAAQALGFSGELKFIIVQLVRLVKDGKEVRMSKRAGNVVYMDELIDEVGHDVARFFFLMYSPDTHMNFDLGLAKERSEKNPVYYVQYAHARICSIIRKAQENLRDSVSLDQNNQKTPNLELLICEKELSLMKELDKFPELVEEIAESYEVHKLPHYAIKLADKFHSFYADCRVIDAENPELSEARLNLVNAVRIVLAETLMLIGVGAPKRM